MSRIGNKIKQYESTFEKYHEEELVVHNFTAGAKDEYEDAAKEPHPASPQTVTGSNRVRGRPSVESESLGLMTETDRVFLLDDSAFISVDGNDEWNGTSVDFPSEIEDTDGRRFVVVSAEPQDNGLIRCLGRAET